MELNNSLGIMLVICEKSDNFTIGIGFCRYCKITPFRGSSNPCFFFHENLFWTDVTGHKENHNFHFKNKKMSYFGISVKEAINNINNSVNGWYLPAIQRPYVWGSRYENEMYICKLFDSILKSYPIGGLIIWNTEEEVPYREFITNYIPGETQKLVDKGLFGRKDKWLIYDGQQRLQTLYSCLRHTFNDKILVYDLLFDLSNGNDPDETGFSFVPKNSIIDWHYIRMNELFVKLPDDDKRAYRKNIINSNPNITDKEEELVEKNVDVLWDVFVKIETKSLAYFPIKNSNEKIVNEVFERLNTGGMALSLADLLFSKIKAEYFDFEEELQVCSKKIYDSTGKGYLFSAYSILQLLHLLISAINS